MSSKRRLDLPPNSGRQAEVEADRLGVADVQIAVRLRGEARVHAAAVLAGLQVLEDDVADEVRRAGRRVRWSGIRRGGGVGRHSLFNFSMAWPMRLRQVSRPSTSRVPNSGGAFLRPQTATRMGWNIWPALMPRRCGGGAQGGLQAVVGELGVGEDFAGASEGAQARAASPFLRNQLGRVVGRQFAGGRRNRPR